MKYINLIFTVVFIASAYLQLNDPDPLLWFIIYLSGAVLCTLSIFHKGNTLLFILALLTYLIYAVILFFAPDGVWTWLYTHNGENITQGMRVSKPWIEKTREFFGLLILAAVTVLNLIRRQKLNRGKEKSK